MAGLNLSTGNIEVLAKSTSTAAGQDLTIKAGQGTGTANGGSILLQVAPPKKQYTKGSAHTDSSNLISFLQTVSATGTMNAGTNETFTNSSATPTLSGGTISDETVLAFEDTQGRVIFVQLDADFTGSSTDFDLIANSQAAADSLVSSIKIAELSKVYAVSTGSAVSGTTSGDLETAVTIAAGKTKKVTIHGDLEVDGVTTQIDSVVTTIKDPLMVLGQGNAAQVDLGLVLVRSGSTGNKFVGYDESDDFFKLAAIGTEDGTTAGNVSTMNPDNVMVGKLALGVSGLYLTGAEGSITAAATSNIVLDAAGDIHLDADGGDVVFKDGGTALLNITNSSSDVVLQPQVANKDIIFKEDGGNEIARFDSSAESLLVAGAKKIEFRDGNSFIHSNDSNDLTLGATDITFDADGDINLNANGGDLIFADDTLEIARFSNSSGDLILSASGGSKDLIFHGNETEIFKLDSSAGSLLMASGKELQFADDGEHISGNGSTLSIVSEAGSIAVGAALADGQTLKLGKNGAVEVIIAPHGTAGSEKYTVTNTAGTAADALGFVATAGGVTITCANAGSDSGTAAKNVNIQGDLLPSSTTTFNLGSSAARWNFVYAGDVDLTNDRGSWTLIEEDSFISFRNNKTGRRYQMIMEDITGTGTYGPGNDGRM